MQHLHNTCFLYIAHKCILIFYLNKIYLKQISNVKEPAVGFGTKFRYH